MREAVKGQSGLMVAVVALMLAIPFSQIPDFTVKYVTSQSLEEMEKNSMRYQSIAHSYKFTSQGLNNDINYTEVQSQINAAPSGSSECSLNPGKFSPEEYNVSYSSVYAGTTFASKDCLNSIIYVAGDTNTPYPELPFYEVKENDKVDVTSRVVP